MAHVQRGSDQFALCGASNGSFNRYRGHLVGRELSLPVEPRAVSAFRMIRAILFLSAVIVCAILTFQILTSFVR